MSITPITKYRVEADGSEWESEAEAQAHAGALAASREIQDALRPLPWSQPTKAHAAVFFRFLLRDDAAEARRLIELL